MNTAKEPKTVFKMTSVADYASDKPVFTKLIETRYGGVNVVALSAHIDIPEHTAPAEVCIYVLEGEMDFRIEGEKHALAAGDALILPAGVPHCVKTHTGVKFILTKLDD